MIPAVAYYRTSSAANVGDDKDSLRRQREAVASWASRNGYEVVAEFCDAAVSGVDPVDTRPGFGALLASEPRVILVENASRFARDLVVQLTGHELLRLRGIELIPVDCPSHFTEDTPTARMVRQILGSVSEFEKAQLVHRLAVARDRVRSETGRCGGRRPLPDAVIARARALRAGSMSFRRVSELLASEGWMNERGKPYDPRSLQRVL